MTPLLPCGYQTAVFFFFFSYSIAGTYLCRSTKLYFQPLLLLLLWQEPLAIFKSEGNSGHRIYTNDKPESGSRTHCALSTL